MRSLAAIMVIAASLAARPVVACTIIRPNGYEGSAKQRYDVREAIERATVIIDGEVIRPSIQGRPALVRVAHVLKGSPAGVIEVGGSDNSCSIELENSGERLRLILTRVSGRFLLLRDQSEARIEDKMLKSDRRKVWPYFPGTP